MHAVDEKETQTKWMIRKAIQELKSELWMLHGDNEPIRKVLAGKLAFAVKQTIKKILDGEQVNEEIVKEMINMEKLAYDRPEVQKTEENRRQYAAAVLYTCKNATAVYKRYLIPF